MTCIHDFTLADIKDGNPSVEQKRRKVFIEAFSFPRNAEYPLFSSLCLRNLVYSIFFPMMM